MAANPVLFRITNFGGVIRDSVSGSAGTEFYASEQLGPYEWESARALGLPQKGEFHPDSRMSFLGTVQSVDRVLEFPPYLLIWKVTYSTGGTFNFSTKLGSRVSRISEQMHLPVMKGSSGNYITRPIPFTRHGYLRVESDRYTGSAEAALNIFGKNLNKLYTPSSGSWISVPLNNSVAQHLQYQLVDVNIITDAGNNSRIDTYFKHRSAVAAFPAGTFPNQAVTIPALPANSDYVPDEIGGSVTVVDPLKLYGAGEALPWL